MSRTRILIGIVVVILLAALGYQGYQRYLAPAPETPPAAVLDPAAGPEAPSVVSAEGQIVPDRQATLAFRLSGRVAELLVSAGSRVEAGQELARLASADLEAAVAQAEAAVHQAEASVALAEAQLDQLLEGPRTEEVAAAEAQVKAAQSAVGQAVAQRDQVALGPGQDAIAAAEAQLAQALAEQKAAQIAYDQIIDNIEALAGPTEENGRFRLNAANEAVAAAQAALDELRAGASEEMVRAYSSAVGVAAYQRDAAKAQLELLKAGASQAQISASRAQVRVAQGALEAAQAGLQAAQAQLAHTVLAAPFAGTIVRLEIEVGEVAVPGAPVLVLADLSNWTMETSDLTESDVVLVQPGQPAVITLDAFADQTFAGQVTRIADVAQINRGNTTYAVTIRLDPTDAALRWGMTAFADIRVAP